VPEVTVGGHFERVAAVYESLRTTDEAPVRTIRQLLPDRRVTGLDIGCGTGRYTRLLRALLPEGSRLAASDVSAAMLAQLKAANHGHAGGVVPLLAAAEQLPLRAASLDVVTAFNCVHHFDLGRFLSAVARVLAPGGQLFIYTRTPQQNARTIWGRYFPGFTEHEQRLHSQAALLDAVRRTGGLTVAAAQTFRQPRSSTAERLRAQAEGRHYSTFSLYPPQELSASIATFLARLPGPEVSWVDEHLLVVAAASRPGQARPDGPASPASQPVKDHAPRSAPGASEAPNRHPGGRAQITPLCAQSIAGQHRQQSAQIGGYARAWMTPRGCYPRLGRLDELHAPLVGAWSARFCRISDVSASTMWPSRGRVLPRGGPRPSDLQRAPAYPVTPDRPKVSLKVMKIDGMTPCEREARGERAQSRRYA
jgi:SAM-dependent methyltransferase